MTTHPPTTGAPRTDVAKRIPIRRIPAAPPQRLASTWRLADPERIAAALKSAQQRSPGGWYAVAASGAVPTGRSTTRSLAGREVVFWRSPDGTLHAGPGACPHLGALLDDCPVVGSAVRCRWHGLALTPKGTDQWLPYAAHDDGALVWVRLPTTDEPPTDAPVLARRAPLAQSVAAVMAVRGRCEPQDVLANRLDPWHGSWFHPYAFSHLSVDDDASSEDLLAVDVTFRLGRTWGIPVRAEFSCPDARTIVMHIVDGEGAGSSVETHATPIGRDAEGHPVTEVLEVTFAHSSRSGFRAVRRLGALLRPAMRHTALRLWGDDLAYAERLYLLRSGTVHTS
jgi:nitrite reductase/ring-hydroxylating ferredoxin subunit